MCEGFRGGLRHVKINHGKRPIWEFEADGNGVGINTLFAASPLERREQSKFRGHGGDSQVQFKKIYFYTATYLLFDMTSCEGCGEADGPEFQALIALGRLYCTSYNGLAVRNHLHHNRQLALGSEQKRKSWSKVVECSSWRLFYRYISTNVFWLMCRAWALLLIGFSVVSEAPVRSRK